MENDMRAEETGWLSHPETERGGRRKSGRLAKVS